MAGSGSRTACIGSPAPRWFPRPIQFADAAPQGRGNGWQPGNRPRPQEAAQGARSAVCPEPIHVGMVQIKDRVVGRLRHAAHVPARPNVDAAMHTADLVLKRDECPSCHCSLSASRKVVKGGGVDVGPSSGLTSCRRGPLKRGFATVAPARFTYVGWRHAAGTPVDGPEDRPSMEA